MKRESRLEGWFVYETVYGDQVLCGTLVDDPRFDPATDEFASGHHVISSPIVASSDGAIETRNTKYLLGQQLMTRNEYWTSRLGVE